MRLWRRRRQPPAGDAALVWGTPSIGRSISASVVGVYGTVHTASGEDHDTGPPVRIEVDCELMLFHCPIPSVDWSGEITSFTIRLGVVNTTVSVDPPVVIRPGANITVVMPIHLDRLEATGGVLR